MATRRDGAGHLADRAAGRKRGEYEWPGYMQALVVVTLTGLFAWLAVSMVEHRFGHGSLSHQMYQSHR